MAPHTACADYNMRRPAGNVAAPNDARTIFAKATPADATVGKTLPNFQFYGSPRPLEEGPGVRAQPRPEGAPASWSPSSEFPIPRLLCGLLRPDSGRMGHFRCGNGQHTRDCCFGWNVALGVWVILRFSRSYGPFPLFIWAGRSEAARAISSSRISNQQRPRRASPPAKSRPCVRPAARYRTLSIYIGPVISRRAFGPAVRRPRHDADAAPWDRRS